LLEKCVRIASRRAEPGELLKCHEESLLKVLEKIDGEEDVGVLRDISSG